MSDHRGWTGGLGARRPLSATARAESPACAAPAAVIASHPR
ncbi:hypothetical protein ACFRMN_16425 [Streptomyces sp. NPDC056835]